MMSQRVRVGVQLWRLYADFGRFLPAAWIARAVGVSPTTMSKHLASEGYTPIRGYTPGRGWNWSRVAGITRVNTMDKIVSNGHEFEVGPEAEIGEGEEFELLDFLTAMTLACDGLAACRFSDKSRAIYRPDETKPLWVGTFNKETGTCTGTERYAPTLEDFQSQDWMILAMVKEEGQGQ